MTFADLITIAQSRMIGLPPFPKGYEMHTSPGGGDLNPGGVAASPGTGLLRNSLGVITLVHR